MEVGQGAQRFFISETNPNDSIGGGGCLCKDGHCEDRGGPYAIFNHVETDSSSSPHVVICAPCVEGVVQAMHGEALKSGEPAIDAEHVEITQPEREANPVSEEGWDEIPAI